MAQRQRMIRPGDEWQRMKKIMLQNKSLAKDKCSGNILCMAIPGRQAGKQAIDTWRWGDFLGPCGRQFNINTHLHLANSYCFSR